MQYKKLQQKIAKGEVNVKSARLTDDRMKRLNDIGFVWSIRHDWHRHYNELLEFKAINGHCNVPARYVPNNRLGIWVTSQRQQYKNLNLLKSGNVQKRPIPLTEDKIKLLEEAGFEWTLRTPEVTWKKRLEELQQFKLTYGTDCVVPSKYKENPRLALFVKTQRYQRSLFDQGKHSTLNQKKIAELDALGFCWVENDSLSIKLDSLATEQEQGADATMENVFNHSHVEMPDINPASGSNNGMYDATGDLVTPADRPSAETVYDMMSIPNVDESYAIANPDVSPNDINNASSSQAEV